MCDSATRPAFIPVPNTARVRMVYSYLGQEVENVLHFRGDAPLITADLSSMVNEVHISWAANIKPHLQSGIVLKFIEATALDTDPGPQVTLLVNEAGTVSGTPLPGNVTVAVKFSSGMSGRSARGRMFWPALDEAAISGNQLTAGFASALLTGVTAFFHDILVASGFVHVIASYCQGKVWLTVGAKTDVLSYILTDNNLDSQRRRLAGRGT